MFPHLARSSLHRTLPSTIRRVKAPCTALFPSPRIHPQPLSIHARLFSLSSALRHPQRQSGQLPPSPRPEIPSERTPTLRENIYTLPNLLTLSRIAACPVLGWSIVHDDFYLATGLLVYAGLTDLVRFPFFSLRVRLSCWSSRVGFPRLTATSHGGSTWAQSWAPYSTPPRTRHS